MRTQAQVLECIEAAFNDPTEKKIGHAIEDIDHFLSEVNELLDSKRRNLVAIHVDLYSKGES